MTWGDSFESNMFLSDKHSQLGTTSNNCLLLFYSRLNFNPALEISRLTSLSLIDDAGV